LRGERVRLYTLGSVTVFVTYRDYCLFLNLLWLLQPLYGIHNICAVHNGEPLDHRAHFLIVDQN